MSNETQVTLEQALEMAKQYHQAGNLTLADRTYRDILKAIPDEFNSLHYLSIICYQTGKPKEGLEFVKKAVSINDNNPDSWNAYGAMQAQLGDYEEAVEKWKKALELEPDFYQALSNLGNAYWELGRFEESRDACQKSVDINPDFFEGWNNLGIAISELGDKEKAIEVWQKAAKIAPNNPDIYANIANALRELGRAKESEEQCNKAIELATDRPKVFFNLGNALRDQGKLKKAEEAYRQAIALKPDFADAYNNLTLILIQMQRYEEALTSARYVIAFQPEHAFAHSCQAFLLKELGRLKDAEDSARTALRIKPDLIDSKIELADILFLSDRYSEAETLFNEVLKETPDSYQLQLKLSGVLERSNKIEEALVAVEKALELSPETPEIHHRKAMILFMSGKTEEAMETIENTLKIKPDFAAAISVKSEILQSMGKMDEALKVSRQAAEINDDTPGLYLTLSKVKKFESIDDPDFVKMRELVDKPLMGRAQKTSLNFALFKAYQDIGDYDKAFEHLKQGNDLKRASVVYDTQAQHIAYNKIKETYTKDFFKKVKGHGCDSDVPIFIVGMPRSGTTLTEQIISSHPDVFGAGELTFLTDIDKHFNPLTEKNCKALGEAYVKRIRAINKEAETARKITDKMPGNYHKISHIVAALPKAKIIHCRRNPMDTCLSAYKQFFARGHYWSYNLNDMAEHYRVYHETMEYWKKVLPKNSFLEIDYEETVSDFENQARKLIDYVEMEWNDACLSPHKQKRSVMTASKGQVIKPIYKTSVEAWRRYEKQFMPLYEQIKDLM